MAERHHSIGEVLSLLKEDHTDLTISKIRFFESQGLISPERTPSGYRKFTDADIDRLRWILTQQRDHFLPLKVIKRRLEEAGFDPAAEIGDLEAGPLPEPTLFSRRGDEEPTGAEPEGAEGPAPGSSDGPETAASDEAVASDEAGGDDSASDDGGVDEEEDEQEDEAAAEPPSAGDTAAEPAAPPAEPVEARPAPPITEGDPLRSPPGSVSLSPAELADATGLEPSVVAELQRLGLIATVADAGGAYDHEALVVCRAAATFFARGVEPRHLRMFKVAAEREAGVLEQLMGPPLRKGGEAAATARAELNELVRLGEQIHRSILRRNLGAHLD